MNFPYHVTHSNKHFLWLHNSLETFLRLSLFYENRQISVTQTVVDVTVPLATGSKHGFKDLLYIVSG